MSINRYLGVNFGSLVLIEYVATQFILDFTLPADNHINGSAILFTPGAGWTPIYCSEDQMGHRQLEVNDDNGQYWNQTVTGFTPGDQDAIETGLLQLRRSRFLLRITRPDGVRKIVGTIDEPLEVVLDSNTQTTIPGAAGTTITFSGQTLERSLIYTGDAPAM